MLAEMCYLPNTHRELRIHIPLESLLIALFLCLMDCFFRKEINGT